MAGNQQRMMAKMALTIAAGNGSDAEKESQIALLMGLPAAAAAPAPAPAAARRRLLSKLFVFFFISSFDPRLRQTLSHYRIIVVASYSGYRIRSR